MLKLTMNLSELEKEVQKSLSSIERGTQWAANQAAQEAGTNMHTYLIAFVYGTVEGNKYVRTEHALDSLGMTLIPNGAGNYILQLANNAEYASQIELGNELDYFEQQKMGGNAQVPQISVDELAMLMDSMAEMGGESHPDTIFDRTGQNPYVPGPHVTPATVDALYKFKKLLRQVWLNAGAIE